LKLSIFCKKTLPINPPDTSVALPLTFCVVAECTPIGQGDHFLRQRMEATMALEKQDHNPQPMERLANKSFRFVNFKNRGSGWKRLSPPMPTQCWTFVEILLGCGHAGV
jgi:hypothetical protein